MIDWQPIETAPKDGTKVLCFGPGVDGPHWPVGKPMPNLFAVAHWNEIQYESYEEVGDGLFRKITKTSRGSWNCGLSWYTPTHWAPLPEGPVKQKGDKE